MTWFPVVRAPGVAFHSSCPPPTLNYVTYVGCYVSYHPVTGKCIYTTVKYLDCYGSGKTFSDVIPNTHVLDGVILYLQRWGYGEDFKELEEGIVAKHRPLAMDDIVWIAVDPAIHGDPRPKPDK